MQLYSTRGQSKAVGIEEAIFQGLPPDNGLYMPEQIPVLSPDFWEKCSELSFTEIALEISAPFFEGAISREQLQNLIASAIDFDAPTVEIFDGMYCLELFHGPSMAFKDFGARFMAAVMNYFLQRDHRKIHILVATSGDTGGAVAQGFYGSSNIDVHILYPSGKVSDIQEKQLTTLGKNIEAIEIEGNFDDCQRLVKSAFLDQDLRSRFNLASANSINIARLIPQAFYYTYAYSRLKLLGKPVVFSVPSGNFGNLSAGVIAYRMGMPVEGFVASTNANKVVPDYLESGNYEPINPSKSTISNAMDVGDPSNFPRLKALFGDSFEELKNKVRGFHYSDSETREAMLELNQKYGYVACPHTAIAYRGLKDYLADKDGVTGVFLSTAHYAKFLPEVESVLNRELEIPDRLKELLSLNKKAQLMKPEYTSFKDHLLRVLN